MASLFKRGKNYYAQYYLGSRQVRKSLRTSSFQVAKEKIRQIESAQLFGTDLPLPTKTAIDKVLAAYAEQLLTVKTFKSAQSDFYILREVFGPACNDIKISPKQYQNKSSQQAKKRFRDYLEVSYFEAVTTADLSQHLAKLVRRKGLAPKTANRYREVLTRLYNWSMTQYGIKMPDGTNPAAKVERYKEKAPKIRFLKLNEIDEQLEALAGHPKLQAMVFMPVCVERRRCGSQRMILITVPGRMG
jgi:hypothetical protein